MNEADEAMRNNGSPDDLRRASEEAQRQLEGARQQVADGLPQVTAWAYERPGGGRGVGYTGGHYHRNWENENTVSLILNAIRWVSDSP